MPEEGGGAGGVQREVVTLFTVREDVLKKLDAIEGKFHKTAEAEEHAKKKAIELGEKFEEVGEKINVLRERAYGLAATIGVGLGIGEMAKKFIEANSAAEQLQSQMGALISTSYQYGKLDVAENFRKSMEVGHKMFEEFQGAALKFGLNAEEMGHAASMLLPQFAKAKVGTHEVGEEVIKLGRIAQRTGRDVGSVSEAINIFLMSGMTRHNPVLGLLELSGMPAGKFTAEQRFEALNKALQKFNVDSIKGTETYQDRINKLKARLDILYEKAGKPFFDVANQEAQELADWMDKNQVMLERLGRDAADILVPALKLGIGALEFGAKHAVVIRDALLAIVATNKIHSLFDSIKEGMEKLEKGAKAKGFESIGENIGRAAAAAQVAQAAFVGYAIGTAINDYLGHQPWWNKLMTPGEGSKEKAADDAIGKLRKDSEIRDRSIGAFFDRKGVGYDAEAASKLKHVIDYLDRHGEKSMSIGGQQGMTATVGQLRQWGIHQGLLAAPEPRSVDTEREHAKAPVQNFYNNRFDIKQQFSEGMDPDRIAVSLTNRIAALGEKPLQSGFAPLFTP